MKLQSTDTLTDDANALIRILRRVFNTFQSIVFRQVALTESPSCLHKISEETKYMLEILRKNKENNSGHSLEIAEKLRQKIRENIHQVRSKWESSLNFKYIKGFCQQMDLGLKIFEKTNNFNQFVSKVYCLINEQLRMFKIRIDLAQNHDDSSWTQRLNRVYSMTEKHHKFGPSEGKIINLVSLYKLDIDTFYMRVTYIPGQKRLMDHINTQLERNKIAQTSIQNFEKTYYLYKLKGKNKQRQILGPKIENKQNIRIKTSIHEKLYRNIKEEKTRRTQTKEKENSQEEIKLTFKVNSLYVSGNQFDVYCQNSKKRWINAQRNKKKSTLMLCQAFKDSLTSKSCSREEKLLINFIN